MTQLIFVKINVTLSLVVDAREVRGLGEALDLLLCDLGRVPASNSSKSPCLRLATTLGAVGRCNERPGKDFLKNI